VTRARRDFRGERALPVEPDRGRDFRAGLSLVDGLVVRPRACVAESLSLSSWVTRLFGYGRGLCRRLRSRALLSTDQTITLALRGGSPPPYALGFLPTGSFIRLLGLLLSTAATISVAAGRYPEEGPGHPAEQPLRTWYCICRSICQRSTSPGRPGPSLPGSD
jgi:hypothetical protein